ncbi:MAG: ABC transporter permease [Gemmatimonadetes bacterium]|nr:ABC transporter permease [Gemmatimonadota bacterium]
MESLLKDVRIAARSLLRARGFTAAAALTLALGIGANTAIFSAVNAVLLSPLPFADPDRLTVLWLNNQREDIQRDVTSYPSFLEWREARSYDAMAGYGSQVATLTGEGDAEQLQGATVSGDFFRVLGVRPRLGRAIAPADTEAGAPRQVVLSHGMWARHFGADPGVVGRSIRLGGSYEVIGVMPPGFRYPDGAEFWTPLARTEDNAGLLDSPGALWLSVIGRLAPGASVEAAQAELTGIMARMAQDDPGLGDNGVFVEPLRDTVIGDVRPALLVLLGAVGFVLLIACANVANLLLARGSGRQRELAVRAALGASGGRLAREAMTESIVLAVLGGGIGVMLATWGTSALVAASPPDLPRIEDVRVDGTVVAFGALLALATGFLFGLVPAVQARRAAIGTALREGDRGNSGDRSAGIRPLLITAEVALSLILLVGAGLLLRSFASLQAVDPGFATERVLSFRVSPGSERYPEAPRIREFRSELMQGLEAVPGVRSATAISTLLLSRLPNMAPVAIEGEEPAAPGEQVTSVTSDFVDPGFFAAMGIPIRRGREFGSEDAVDGLPVAVVNEAFVRRFLPDHDPIGRRFTWGDPEDTATTWLTIVGVVADSRRSGMTAPVRPEAYRSTGQYAIRTMECLVRTTGDPLALVPDVRALLRRIDPEIPLARVRTVDQALGEAVATRRFVMLLLVAFAAVAVTLTAVGIYGVLTYLVGQRTRELGVRMALGARRADVLRLVLGDAMKSILPGLLLGVLGALLLTRLLTSQLFGVRPTDPLTFTAVTFLLLAVALTASWMPARKAAGVEPMVTLRQD